MFAALKTTRASGLTRMVSTCLVNDAKQLRSLNTVVWAAHGKRFKEKKAPGDEPSG